DEGDHDQAHRDDPRRHHHGVRAVGRGLRPRQARPVGVNPGAPAPDFALASTAGSEVRLSGFCGKSNVLLAFFPLAFTSTCTAELCAFSEDFDRFASAATTVLPISV